MITMMANDAPTMRASLIQWFLYCVGVSAFTAFVVGGALEPGAAYGPVFHFVALVSFAGYAGALLQNSIWYNLGWAITAKNVVAGAVYALVSAGTFGWLWP